MGKIPFLYFTFHNVYSTFWYIKEIIDRHFFNFHDKLCFVISKLFIWLSFYENTDDLFVILQDEFKQVSTEGQNLRLDSSARFQDAIKV